MSSIKLAIVVTKPAKVHENLSDTLKCISLKFASNTIIHSTDLSGSDTNRVTTVIESLGKWNTTLMKKIIVEINILVMDQVSNQINCVGTRKILKFDLII